MRREPPSQTAPAEDSAERAGATLCPSAHAM
jgi:hypothetical protein